MFAPVGPSRQFAKFSYGIIRDFKKLSIFPVLSALAAAAIIASFVVPRSRSLLGRLAAVAEPDTAFHGRDDDAVLPQNAGGSFFVDRGRARVSNKRPPKV